MNENTAITIVLCALVACVAYVATLSRGEAWTEEPTKTVAMFAEETQEQKRTCHFLRCLYVAEDNLGMELVCSQTPAICPPEERIDQ